MDDLNRSIKEYIKSKQYFIDARIWYANKFVNTISERTFTGLLCLIFVFASLVLLSYASQINHSNSYTYLANIKDLTKNYTAINEIGSANENPQNSIDKFMLSKYVTERESYEFNKLNKILDNKFLYLQQNSSPQEYQKYINSISYNNTSSPLYLYQDSVVITVLVNKVILIPNKEKDKNTKNAEIYFSKTIRNISINKTQTKNYIANVSFIIDNIEQDIGKHNFKFKVMSYTLRNNGNN